MKTGRTLGRTVTRNELSAERLPVSLTWDMILRMTDANDIHESGAALLCKACGLCCTGHLFTRTKLRSAEMDEAQALGLTVLRSHPNERGFRQPCPLWQGECTIYTSPHYPRFCRTYKCKLLNRLMEETIPLTDAMALVQQAKEMIHEVEALLPQSQDASFRERLEIALAAPKLHANAEELRAVYDEVFGVNDLG